MNYHRCGFCGEEFPDYFEACPKCRTKVESNPYQLLLPSIMGKTATYMREKYKRVPEATHVHDLTRCSTKREMEERFPELAETVLLKPPVQIGEMVHTFIESLPTIDKAQQIIERRVNTHLVVGKPDITTKEAVYCLKYRRRLYPRPRDHDILEAGIYAWLARKPYGHVIYLNPSDFREWVYSPVTTETVLWLIEHPMSPRWGWECRICPFKQVCPIRIRASSNPQGAPTELMTWDYLGAFVDAEASIIWSIENTVRFHTHFSINQSNHERGGYQLLEEMKQFIQKELGIEGTIRLREPPRMYTLFYERIMDVHKLCHAILPHLKLLHRRKQAQETMQAIETWVARKYLQTTRKIEQGINHIIKAHRTRYKTMLEQIAKQKRAEKLTDHYLR